MGILYLHEAFGSLGGAEANVFSTAMELKKRGRQIGLLTRRGTGKNEAGWTNFFGDALFRLGQDSLGETVRRFRPEVVYVHKWSDLASLEELVASGVPCVQMVHDHDSYCLRSYRYNPLTRNVCHRPLGAYCIFPCLAPIKRDRGGPLPIRWASFLDKKRELELTRRFDRSIVATTYMRDELLLNGFAAGRIEILPPAPAPAAPLQSSFSDRNLLVYAGQIVRGKGVDVLLRALSLVKTPFEALILGDGNFRRECEVLCRELGLENRVTFKGFVPPAELQSYYGDATAMMVPSVWPEPMGLVGLEAMRNALPVVGFDAGGISDWLHDGDNGFLVPWMDTQLFARRIDELLYDKAKAREMGRRGFERVIRDYDFTHYIDKLEEIFARVAGERREMESRVVPETEGSFA